MPLPDRVRPVILLGEGARGCDLSPILKLSVPILTSWPAKDLIDNGHEWYFGSPGVYGQRVANMVLYHADTIMALGNRMSVWNVGYEGPRLDQQVAMVDVDRYEATKFPHAAHINSTVAEWLKTGWCLTNSDRWQNQCKRWRDELPLIEPAHADANGYINSYRFMDALHPYLPPDAVIVTDMGTPHICAHQVLRLKPPQRLMSSGGLGEMGCGLPAAIGASFATGKGPVLCMVGDGGMMLNLQELQTIVHHQLPIKIIVFENDGYGMIKKTQERAGQQHVAVDRASGVSCPDFISVAEAFGIEPYYVYAWSDFHEHMESFFRSSRPSLMVYHMDPDQDMVPKVFYNAVTGKYDSLDNMSPKLNG